MIVQEIKVENNLVSVLMRQNVITAILIEHDLVFKKAYLCSNRPRGGGVHMSGAKVRFATLYYKN